ANRAMLVLVASSKEGDLMKKIVFGLTVALLCAAVLIAPPASTAHTDCILTDRGLVRGNTVGAVDQFLGVPYAAPPVGDLRWKAPIPAPRWHGVRDATSPGNACIQQRDDARQPTSEDCLYLNIYRPRNIRPGRSLPVLFWIHGGYNTDGSGND